MRLCSKSALAAAVTLLSLAEPVCARPQTVNKQAEKWQIDGINAALSDPVPEVRTTALYAGAIQLSDFKWSGILTSLLLPLLQDSDKSVGEHTVATALNSPRSMEDQG